MASQLNRPNVLFIFSDQHSAKALGCNGHPDVKTPHLDRLAKRGVRCQNAIAQNPICTPSRVSWLSGQYCHNHGYYGLSGPQPFKLPSILGHFRLNGYTSAAIGKIHCPANWIEEEVDVFHDPCGSSIGGRDKEYSSFLSERGVEELEDHGALNEFGDKGRQSLDARPSKVSYDESQEGWTVQKTIEFMKSASDSGKPFFAFASLPKPHQCYAPAQEFWDMYDPEKLTLPPNADSDLKGKAPTMKGMVSKFRTADWALFEPKTFEGARRRKLHGYLGNVSHVDHSVGEFTDWLELSGLDDSTIVVYSTDHGEYVCEHGIMEKAPGICSDTVTRIPLIWSWKNKLPENRTVDELIEAVDVSTTLCEMAGIPHLDTSDGKDVSAILKGDSDASPVRSIAVTEFAWSKSVRKGDFRLVYYPKEMFPDDYPDGFGELYNLKDDPWETNNLYFDPAYQETVREIKQDLMDWLITTSRPRTVFPSKSSGHDYETRDYHNFQDRDGKVSVLKTKNQVFGTYL